MRDPKNFQATDNADWCEGPFALTEGGEALDLTGAALQLAVIDLAGIEVLRLTNGDRITVTDAPAGRFEWRVTAADMAALVPLYYRYDLLVTFADGKRKRALYGMLTVHKGQTLWQ